MPESSVVAESAIAQPPGKGAERVYQSKRQLMLANFLGGISWGFGSVIGATIVVALVLILLKSLGGLPVIGSYISDIAKSVSTTTHP
jgi:hypothetical protein